MLSQRRIYLDNAATSWPKPEAVYAAVDRFQREVGASAGRGVYAEAGETDRLVGSARAAIARLLGAADTSRIVFTFNGTDALNLAIHGLLRQGDHVVTTVAEHNSVLRPLRQLEDAGLVEVTRVRCNGEGVVDPDAIRLALRPHTALVAAIHASNVTGALQPVAEIGRIARDRGIRFLVDAAQTLGHIPVSVEALGVDLLAAPGHKGLLGPQGTGILYVRPGVENDLRSTRQGGTGSRSDEDWQPDLLPDKYESGTLNVPGILGLGEGVRYVQSRGIESIRRHAVELTERLTAGLAGISGITIHGPRDAIQRVGVVSVTLAGYDPQEVALTLDSVYRIQVRSGIQCAPLLHRALGTLDRGGIVRLSIGTCTTSAEIDAAVAAVAEIVAAGSPA
ncbi:MAG: aminotransferase class V-fold PLP-dependent enzyme [Pirellulales bacterium]